MQRFIIIIIGIIFLALGGFLFFKNQNLVKNCTEEVSATVVDMKQEFDTSDNGGSYVYFPIIEYIVDGNTIRVTMDKSSSTPAYDIGEEITVLYNPNKVKEFIVKGDKSSNIFSIVFMVIGTLVAGYGVVVALKKN